MEGVEPSSKQGNHTLSTRLFRPWFFVLQQDPDHQPQPYLLKLHCKREAECNYFRFHCTAISECFGTTASERCLVPAPCAGIKPVTYCSSVRQRERSCFRQINCRWLIFRSRPPKLHVLTYHFIPLSNPFIPIEECAFLATSHVLDLQSYKFFLNWAKIEVLNSVVWFNVSTFIFTQMFLLLSWDIKVAQSRAVLPLNGRWKSNYYTTKDQLLQAVCNVLIFSMVQCK